MGQITIYLDDELEKKLRAASERAKTSRSRWIAEVIRQHLDNEWPAEVREAAGAWGDFPTSTSLELVRTSKFARISKGVLYVLDTNTAIYYFKGMGRVASRLLDQAPRQLGLSAVVEYELLVGIEKSNSPDRRRRQLQAFKSAVTYLPFAQEEAHQAGRLRAFLERSGAPTMC